MQQVGVSVEFAKADETGKYVRGFASVIEVDGQPIEDFQGDVIDMDTLRKAAHAFIADARVAKAMHQGVQVGEVVESVLIDDDFAKALGLTDPRRGWFIGMRVDDPKIQKMVRDGTYRAFSIGGRGKRTKMES